MASISKASDRRGMVYLTYGLHCLWFLILNLGCAHTSDQARSVSAQSCEQTRGAFDVGSGSTKLTIAKVNVCRPKILEVLFKDSYPNGFEECRLRSKSNSISTECVNQHLSVIEPLIVSIRENKVDVLAGIGTSVFRKAANGKEALKQLERGISDQLQGLKLTLAVLDQDREGAFGFYAAVIRTGLDPNEVVVWDIGGGSQQISYLSDKKQTPELAVAKLKLASVTFKDKVQRVLGKVRSPNPVGKENTSKLVKLAKGSAGVNEEISRVDREELSARGKTWIGVGGVHFYSVMGQLTNQNAKDGDSYRLEEVLTLLGKQSKKTDAELNKGKASKNHKYSVTEVTNLALVSGIAKAIGLDPRQSIRVENISMSEGLLSHMQDPLWQQKRMEVQ